MRGKQGMPSTLFFLKERLCTLPSLPPLFAGMLMLMAVFVWNSCPGSVWASLKDEGLMILMNMELPAQCWTADAYQKRIHFFFFGGH